MSDYLILTSAQADSVRGPTAPGHALEPVLLADGATYVLPADVLADPAHVVRHDALAALPQRAVPAAEFSATGSDS